MKGRLGTLITATTTDKILYGLVELTPDGMIQKINNEGKRLLLSDEKENGYLFQCIKNKEIKAKLHECFMGKLSEFIVTIDSQPYFFYFIDPIEMTY